MFGRLICSLTPGFVYKEVQFEEHKNLHLSALLLTFILKPTSGFLSMGFFKVSHPDDRGAILGKLQGGIRTIQ